MTGARPRVIVVGAVNEDLVLRVARIALPGQTVGDARLTRTPGGKGGNQAVAAARLGADVHFVGRVGIDDAGVRARHALEAEGVDVRSLTVTDRYPTGTAAVVLDAAGENAITVAPGANGALSAADVVTAIDRLPEGQATLLVSLEVPLAAAEAAIRAGSARGWTVVVNPAPPARLDEELLALVDVLTPNAHEAAELHEDGPDGLLRAGVGHIVVTRGGDGVRWITPAGVRDLPAVQAPHVIDTTGAGDAFSGTLAWAVAFGLPMADAVVHALGAGSLAVGAVGARAGLARLDDLRHHLARSGPGPRDE